MVHGTLEGATAFLCSSPISTRCKLGSFGANTAGSTMLICFLLQPFLRVSSDPCGSRQHAVAWEHGQEVAGGPACAVALHLFLFLHPFRLSLSLSRSLSLSLSLFLRRLLYNSQQISEKITCGHLHDPAWSCMYFSTVQALRGQRRSGPWPGTHSEPWPLLWSLHALYMQKAAAQERAAQHANVTHGQSVPGRGVFRKVEALSDGDR